MNTHNSTYRVDWWERNLEELDREIGRLALICRVRLFDQGVIDRLLKGDDSVCTARNSVAFGKLCMLMRMHFVIRQQSADELGQRQTFNLESYIIERLRKAFPDLGTHWPPV